MSSSPSPEKSQAPFSPSFSGNLDTSNNSLVESLRNRFHSHWKLFYRSQYATNDAIGPVIQYILEGPGKRARALICLLTSMCQKALTRHSFNSAIAIEMVHAYSLVHDDLPCMDDDSMRRGRKTAHIAFDVPRALLAGDALLADAFVVLTQEGIRSISLNDMRISNTLVHELALACGSRGMVWGQVLDLHWTGRSGATLSDLVEVHSTKTAWLLGCSAAMGAISVGAPNEAVEEWRLFGRYVGLAFQVIDDLLDSSTAIGKTQGKDARDGKLTYPGLLGKVEARAMADELTDKALETLAALTGNIRDRAAPEALQALVKSLLHRNS